jgi:hypothetical protein
MSRRGRPSRCAIALAAVGSVGETMAPSTNAPGQVRPGMAAWATTATASIVVRTRPTARRVIGRTLARSSRSDVKKAVP